MAPRRRRSARRLVAAIAMVPLFVAAACTPPPTTTPTTTAPTTTVDPNLPYDIVLRPVGTIDPAVRAVFDSAASRWEHLITADVPAVDPGPFYTGCVATTPTGPIDDMVIDIQVTPIDGAGGVLGSAGPCAVSTADGLPRAGAMVFDSADVADLMADGQFQLVVLHEMAHVLGVGTVWTDKGLLTGTTGSDPRFTGAQAVAAWHTLGGTGDVPVEATGGSGTALAHWRESTFANELMTGWLNPGTNSLSTVTVASLADIGYQVDLSGADAYTLPPSLLGPALRADAVANDPGDVLPITPDQAI